MIWDVDQYLIEHDASAYIGPLFIGERPVFEFVPDNEHAKRVRAIVQEKRAKNYGYYLRRKERLNGTKG